jgi:hypothetical protein
MGNHQPPTRAQTLQVKLTSEEVAMLIGRVFLHRAAVNLLGSVLDTPEFFVSGSLRFWGVGGRRARPALLLPVRQQAPG